MIDPSAVRALFVSVFFLGVTVGVLIFFLIWAVTQ